jgi:hypothetical protein
MNKIATVLTVDLKGFNKRAQAEDACATANFITEYYRYIDDLVTFRGWRFVKGMGDCIMVVAEGEVESKLIRQFFEEIFEKYSVSVVYRLCEFVDLRVEIGGYTCLDIIGKDICNLFLRDESTTKLG